MYYNEPVIIQRVNGVYHLPAMSGPFVLNGRRYDSGTEGIFADAPESLAVVQTRSVITHYMREDGERMEVDAFNAIATDMRKAIDPLTHEWATLDAEYAWRKFDGEWTAQRTTEEYERPLAFTIHDITGDTTNPYIVPMRLLGGPTIKGDDVLYRYTPVPFDFATAAAKKYGFEFVPDGRCGAGSTSVRRWTVPDHSLDSLDFLQINGDYYRRGWKFYSITAGTLDECRERYQKHTEWVESAFRDADLRMTAVGKTYDAAGVAGKLQELSSLVRRIAARSKSEVSPSRVAQQLDALRADVLSNAAKEDE